MSTALIWIVFPGLFSALLYFVRHRRTLTVALGAGTALLLAGLGVLLPIGERIAWRLWPGFPAFTINPTLSILGRRFILDEGSRPLLIFVYVGIAFWFGGSLVAKTSRLFVPIGMGIAALFMAVIAVEPVLFAALLIELVVLLSLPLLSSPGKPGTRGALRFLSLQTLGVPFILMTGWMLPSLETTGFDTAQGLRAAAFAVLGFCLFMAVFPFHTWIPMSAEEADPYAAAFVFFMLPGVVSLFAMEFLIRYAWLSSVPLVFIGMRFLGSVMVALGGIWAAFQQHLGRILGYAVLLEVGLSLLALSVGFNPVEGNVLTVDVRNGIFYSLLLPRGLALGVWALALAVVRERAGDLTLRSVQGLGRSYPLAMGAIVLANFSLAGLPLLAGFPIRVALWSEVAEQSLVAGLFTILGSAGLMAGGLRSLAVLIMGPEDTNWRIGENRSQAIFILTAIAMLIWVGITPQLFFPFLSDMAAVFSP